MCRAPARSLLPGRLVALPAPTGGRRQPARITLDKSAHAAITALADGTVVSLEATGSEVTTHTWNARRTAEGPRRVDGERRHPADGASRSPRRQRHRRRQDLQRRGRRRVGEHGGAGAGRGAREGEAAEADDHLRVVRQRGGRRLRRALFRRAAAGAARSHRREPRVRDDRPRRHGRRRRIRSGSPATSAPTSGRSWRATARASSPTRIRTRTSSSARTTSPSRARASSRRRCRATACTPTTISRPTTWPISTSRT